MQRWQECDEVEDPIARLDCRTSKLNDGFHRLEAQMTSMDWKLRMTVTGSVFAGLGGLAKLLETLHTLGVF